MKAFSLLNFKGKGGCFIVTQVFEVVGDIVTGIVAVFIELFSSLTAVFWTATEGGGGTLTIIGIFALLGFGVALAKWGFNLILRLIRMNK